MTLDYQSISLEFKPTTLISKLLVGESPPPNGTSYFYLPKVPIKLVSLPATIFLHYFDRVPQTQAEYLKLLYKLKHKGIYLIDICDTPLKIRIANKLGGINKENLEILKRHIPLLKLKLKGRNIDVFEEDIIFLLARKNYKTQLVLEFPKAKFYTWKMFRETREKLFI